MRKPTPSSAHSGLRTRTEGIALLITLTMMALLTILVVAILTQARNEMASSYLYTDNAKLQTLKDISTNLVISQIKEATTREGEIWASQPGAVRSYDDTGKMAMAYKLYSSGKMREENEADLIADAPQSSWDTFPEQFVDLNSPILAEGEPVFPIADPRAAGLVEGFDFDASTLAGARYPVGGSDSAARLPMPVRWIYVLEDGTIGTLDGSGLFESAEGVPATEENPITGRIAFWTDDDCAKLNVNTASEGTHWATPRVTTQTEKYNLSNASYTTSVPGMREYQRYPGHPSTVCLSPALDAWNPVPSAPHGYTSASNKTDYASSLIPYFDAAPRAQHGASQGGTVVNTRGGGALYQEIANAWKPQRLYANVDEYLLRPDRAPNSGLGGSSMKRLRFFLTADSRAPETTLFDTPRIAMYPQYDPNGGGKAGPFAGLLKFCSTVGEAPYYFQRKTPWIGAANSSAASPTADMTVTRNAEIYRYLQRMTSEKVPGFGGTFESKYGNWGRDQILTESLDYIRSSVNITHNTDGSSKYAANDRNWAIPLQVTTQNSAGDDQETMGFGRHVTITEAALIFHVSDVEGTDGNGDGQVTGAEITAVKVKVALVLEPYSVAPGFRFSPNMRYTVRGLQAFGVQTPSSFGFANSIDIASNVHVHVCGGNSRTALTGIYELPAPTRYGVYPLLSPNEITIPISTKTMSLTGGTITIEAKLPGNPAEAFQTLHMEFPNQAIPVPIDDPNYRNFGSHVYRSYTYNNSTDPWNGAGSYYGGMLDRLIRPGDVVRSVELIGNGPSGGDVRMITALREVDKGYFGVHPDYRSSTARQVGSLATTKHGCGDLWWNGNLANRQFGFLAASGLSAPPLDSGGGLMDNRLVLGSPVSALDISKYHPVAVPYVMRDTNGLNADGRPGDFDTGQGIQPDGCYINKPDETMAGDTWRDWWQAGWYGSGAGAGNFTPNRQVPSPVQLGSLPTGIDPDPAKARPWQTLLFCPNPASRTTASSLSPTKDDHFGFGAPHDHLWLDLFSLPTTDPWAISEPLSTAGKVNMNHVLAGFPHITRTTALRGVLKPTRVLAIPVSSGGREVASDTTYKTGNHATEMRYDVNVDETLAGISRRFDGSDSAGKGLYVSPSEICDIFLVPQRLGDGATYADARPTATLTYAETNDWWTKPDNSTGDNHFALTGDNAREEPYNRIYPLLTTRSNTFTVHMRVQTIRQNSENRRAGTWKEGEGGITGEYQGSTTLERHVDPADPELPDFATDWTDSSSDNLSEHYRFRVLHERRFEG